MKIKSYLKVFAGAAALVLLLTTCSKDGEPGARPDVRLSDTSLGKVLTDKEGMTLYFLPEM